LAHFLWSAFRDIVSSTGSCLALRLALFELLN
jgi:hypothetical protein